MLLLGLKTTKILPTKPWHKRDISDSGLEICQAGGAANSCETCFFSVWDRVRHTLRTKTLSKSAVMTPSFVEPHGLFLEHFGLNLQFIK